MYSRKSIIRKTRRKNTIAKSRSFLWKFAVFFFVAVSATGILAWQSWNERVIVSEIAVEGNNVTEESMITNIIENEMSGKYLFLFSKKNIALYPKEAIIANILEAQKRIYDVDVYRDSLTKISVKVYERLPEYMVCVTEYGDEGEEDKKRCLFADDKGYIFAHAPYFSDQVFFEWNILDNDNIHIGDRILSDEEFAKLLEFKSATESVGFEPASFSLWMSNKKEINLDLKDGSRIMFNIDNDTNKLVDNLESALETIQVSGEELEYIDLRFGSKVFYKFR